MSAANGRRLQRHAVTLLLDGNLLTFPLTFSGFVTAAFLWRVRRHEKLRARDTAAPQKSDDEEERKARAVDGSEHATSRILNLLAKDRKDPVDSAS